MFDIRSSECKEMFEVYDTETLKVKASFEEEVEAENYVARKLSQSKIDCCKTSLGSNGWHHCSDCTGEVSFVKPDGSYRMYRKDNGSETHFSKDTSALNDWWCTHGAWTGTVKGGNELVLHHAYGKAEYDSYEESNKPIPFACEGVRV
jgi:hypothetical protein